MNAPSASVLMCSQSNMDIDPDLGHVMKMSCPRCHRTVKVRDGKLMIHYAGDDE
jgi:hypothetical protein